MLRLRRRKKVLLNDDMANWAPWEWIVYEFKMFPPQLKGRR